MSLLNCRNLSLVIPNLTNLWWEDVDDDPNSFKSTLNVIAVSKGSIAWVYAFYWIPVEQLEKRYVSLYDIPSIWDTFNDWDFSAFWRSS